MSKPRKTGAPDNEIEISEAMLDAGVSALTAGLLEECSVEVLRPGLVAEIYRAMHREHLKCKFLVRD